jgi:hypothetical protein
VALARIDGFRLDPQSGTGGTFTLGTVNDDTVALDRSEYPGIALYDEAKQPATGEVITGVDADYDEGERLPLQNGSSRSSVNVAFPCWSSLRPMTRRRPWIATWSCSMRCLLWNSRPSCFGSGRTGDVWLRRLRNRVTRFFLMPGRCWRIVLSFIDARAERRLSIATVC